MIIQIDTYRRIFTTLCLLLFFWIIGGFTLTLHLTLTGTLFLIAAISMLWYLPFIWLVKKVKNIDIWRTKEWDGLSGLIAFLFAVGAMEAYASHFKLSGYFIGGILLMILFYYAYFQIKKKNESLAAINKNHQFGLLFTGILGMVLAIGMIVRYTYSTLPSNDTKIVLFENSDPQMDTLALIFSLEVGTILFLTIYILITNAISPNRGTGNKKLDNFKWGIAGKSVIGMTLLLIGSIVAEYEPLIEILLPIYFLMLFALGGYWIVKQIKAIIHLKNEQTRTELLHLKSQVNPHFFFNTLNNLYGLVEKDSQKARALILKLSDMMRYSIYEGQKEEVALEDEILYLKNYIELHQMRYHKQIKVDFTAEIQDGGYKVMPLLFIILLENAFKHGVENLINTPFVQVHISAYDEEVHFAVTNNFEQSEQANSSGIGLKNLKRRLELAYQNRHTLSFSIVNNVYKAQLSIKP